MEGFRFGPVLTDKVIDVVKRVGDMPYRYGNASIPVRFEDDGGGGGGGGSGLIEGEFCGAWPKGQVKQVILSSDGTGTSTTSAINYLYSIQPIDTPSNYRRRCIVMAGGVVAGGLDPPADCTLVSSEE